MTVFLLLGIMLYDIHKVKLCYSVIFVIIDVLEFGRVQYMCHAVQSSRYLFFGIKSER